MPRAYPPKPWSKEKMRAYASAYGKRRRQCDDHSCLLEYARRRAYARGLQFDLTRKDIVIPECCPVLGIPLVRRTGQIQQPGRKNAGPRPNAPSIDRIRPEDGYVPGNVRVISFRANTVRGNATVDELRRVLADAERLEGRCCPTATPHPPPLTGHVPSYS